MKNEKSTTKQQAKESLWERQQNFRNFVAARSTGKFKRKGVKK